LAEELDPRDELIQRLIEYRHFKQASRDLGERFEARSRIHEHAFVPEPDSGPTLDLEELSHWDLMAAFSRLMRETLANKQMVITADERPLRYYVERLVHSMRTQRRLSLRTMVESATENGAPSKRVMIGTFCALLELVKIGVVRAEQSTATEDITIVLRDDVGDDIDQIVKLTEFDDEKAPEEAAPQAPTDAAAETASTTTETLPDDESADEASDETRA
jgi:segregation and condensation protein A